jgi:hypothetical protein
VLISAAGQASTGTLGRWEESKMATIFGNHSLAPGQSAAWFFARDEGTQQSAFLPVIYVRPLSPSTDQGQSHFVESLDQMSFPTWNALGVSTLWCQYRNDMEFVGTLVYFLTVFNFSQETVIYAFVEQEL